MKVIEKIVGAHLSGFEWLNFNYLPDSDGFKFEIYSKKNNADIISHTIYIFFTLFRDVKNDIIVKNFGEGSWGDFCIDTWDFENNLYDYSPDNKEEPTASYLTMLNNCEISPNYSGFCKCTDWARFLYITLNCIVSRKAPYSMMFYVPNHKFVFYFHHTGSFGVYYKDLDNFIIDLINAIKQENLEIKNSTDKRIIL